MILTKSVTLDARDRILIEASGSVECDWNNVSRDDNTHCFISIHIQEKNTRPGDIPRWCNADTDVVGYGEQSNNRFHRERLHSFDLNTTCTPPTSGTYDVVLYGHVVSGDGSRDYTSLKIKDAKYNILG